MGEPSGVELLSHATAKAPTKTSSDAASTNLRIEIPPLWKGYTFSGRRSAREVPSLVCYYVLATSLATTFRSATSIA